MAKEKQRKALELRKAGVTYAAIAEQVGYSDAANARRAVVTAMEEVVQEPAVELRSIQMERLNHMLMLVWGKINQRGDDADLSQIDRALRIMQQMDALMGTVSAQEVHHKHEGVVVFGGSKDEYIEAMQQMAGADPKEIEALRELGTGEPDDIVDAEIVSDTAEDGMSYVQTEGRDGPAFPVIELEDEEGAADGE
jgi:hypothetical protein